MEKVGKKKKEPINGLSNPTEDSFEGLLEGKYSILALTLQWGILAM